MDVFKMLVRKVLELDSKSASKIGMPDGITSSGKNVEMEFYLFYSPVRRTRSKFDLGHYVARELDGKGANKDEFSKQSCRKELVSKNSGADLAALNKDHRNCEAEGGPIHYGYTILDQAVNACYQASIQYGHAVLEQADDTCHQASNHG